MKRFQLSLRNSLPFQVSNVFRTCDTICNILDIFFVLLLNELKKRSICGYFEITIEIETETMTHF
jgi:hypothetical protein